MGLQSSSKGHLGIFTAICLLAGLVLYALYFVDVSLVDYALGFFSGIALYSLFWRWRYGFWPD